ncbi:dihydrofolate reductase family protein [Dyella telluris]|uniref:Dihydrofolate reductase family protein n=1 Tax=Dyella telluris TaxID=2763498 RepID=A0A7G8Q5T6_9GAMM|nr:dihydrofolate reductase family protein [Dyella telluris]QNK02144.1 dihydrofolate reductase family protein [Dyella telluris]
MAKFVYGLNVSLDGYIDHQRMGVPDPVLFRHFVAQVRGLAGMVYGRQMYEVMRYWDEDGDNWGADEHDYATAWRSRHKWVVSRSLSSVGPNATLISDDIDAALRRLKSEVDGEMDIAGTVLAQSLAELSLIDEYRLYLHPLVLGHGKPYFSGTHPRLHLVASEVIANDVIRLTYVPA